MSLSSHFYMACVSVCVVTPAIAQAVPRLAIGGRQLEFDAATSLTVLSQDGTHLLRSAATVDTSIGNFQLGQNSLSTKTFSTTGSLPGEALQIHEQISTAGLELRYTATLLKDIPGATFQLELVNHSQRPVQVSALKPLVAASAHQGDCLLSRSGEGAFQKVLTNGRMYHDPGKLIDLRPPGAHFTSFFNVALYCPGTSETLVIGYLDGREFEGYVKGGRDSGGVGFETASIAGSTVEIAPGQTASGGSVLVLFRANPFDALEQYADSLAAYHKVRLNPVINGWCTWSNMYGDITEERVLKNARVIANELKAYGMEWVQIDDGFQRAFGDWEALPGKLPNGMKDLATKITALGLKPGLWLAPFAISKGTDVATNHPEWLVHRPDGTLQDIEPAHQGQAQYILDVSKAGARDWLHRTFSTVANDWGYRFIKTDFSEWTLLATQRFADASWSIAKAYYVANETIRSAIGPDVHLLDCGPTPEIIGLADSMRIELDRPISAECNLWDQYALHYNSTAPAVAKRYYFHGRTWINDADHIRLVTLDLPQAQVAATITALSGGTIISGDQLYDLDRPRMEILKKVLPSFGKSARPIDLFETTQPALFITPIASDAGKWTVAGVFNWHDTTATRRLTPERLCIAAGTPLLAFDFWQQQLLDGTKGELEFLQPPRSVTLLAVRERTGGPQVLGTSRHFTQGAIELKKVNWNAQARTLSGTALGAPGMSYHLFAYVPDGFAISSLEGATRAASPDKRVAKLQLDFDNEPARNWSVAF
ncbi:MAG: glycoside hydrolase family 36 protein [Candidatus Sumerlaeaceae bacterium]